ncbi:MAG: aminoacyl-tRNA hydrolase [Actinobacteria bacterium]|nr:aminoacyl-tRNA hydrolase [Actinomycetota bacterium]
MPGDRWLIAGLGNPEAEYGGTRHNVGADTVRLLAERYRRELTRNRRVDCDLVEVTDGDHRLVLALPDAYMNRSGRPIQQALAWYKLAPDHLIVIHDDLDLAPAVLRLKVGGGPGGHNGLKDIDRALGTRQYLRVRIGIGRPPGRMDPADYVLRRFDPAERTEIDVTIEHAADAVLSLVRDGLEPTQNRYHAS